MVPRRSYGFYYIICIQTHYVVVDYLNGLHCIVVIDKEVFYRSLCTVRSLKTFIFRYQDLVEIYSVSAEKIINDGFSYSENV
jgi:hypothetical protein